MKERPILFSGPMVRAILDGRKTQTRRVIKPQPGPNIDYLYWPPKEGNAIRFVPVTGPAYVLRCPYGQPGDRLWVKERVRIVSLINHYNCEIENERGVRLQMPSWGTERWVAGEWRRARWMPKAAASLTLEVVSIRVQRVQEISESDARAEGATEELVAPGDCGSFVAGFYWLWDSINHKRPGCAWSDNPWVWAVEFKAIRGDE